MIIFPHAIIKTVLFAINVNLAFTFPFFHQQFLNKRLYFILGNGCSFWQSFGSFGLNLMCSWSINLSDSSGPTTQRLPEEPPGETNIHTLHFLFIMFYYSIAL